MGSWRHLPGEPDPEAPLLPEWWGPPWHVLGVDVPVAQVLVRRDQFFVGLRSLLAYRTGLVLEVAAAVRRAAFDTGDWKIAKASLHQSVGRGGRPGSRGGFRIGVELADGRRTWASNDHDRLPLNVRPEGPLLTVDGEGGHSSEWVEERALMLWLWPIPVGEAMSVAVQWPYLGLSLTLRHLALAPVHAAARLAEPYWP